MTTQHDDLDAVRAITEALQPFDDDVKLRIIRWARERLGLEQAVEHPARTIGGPPAAATARPAEQAGDRTQPHVPAHAAPTRAKDIKSFVKEKAPTSDQQFAALVAYYHAFEAPETKRRTEITSADYQDAARKAGWPRSAKPSVTINNAIQAGYLDRGSKRGRYRINTVGENLVAMALPDGGDNGTPGPAGLRKPAKKSGKRKNGNSKPKAKSKRKASRGSKKQR